MSSLGEVIAQFHREGWALGKSLFSTEEALAIRDHLMEVRKGPCLGDDTTWDPNATDPLRQFPRIIHPHLWDSVCRDFMIDPRLKPYLAQMMDDEPVAVQTMVYFKPPGARGQALHQDQFYLRVQPATCVAAWMALDVCDEANGGMMVVPGTQNDPILCPIPADTEASFTTITVPLRPDAEIITPRMQPGDVLFFNGALVHGSGPNTTSDRWRRALIGHYAPKSTQSMVKWYADATDFDGNELHFSGIDGDNQCGVFEEGGAIRMTEQTFAGPLEKH
ncbi:MAG: phytanoyl-CoA dioxygenase family protein [Armatimonadetes bacterium]|nr:phytanoyl-CoA dioxygenase family protein [Armatimonadota bacterium]